MLAAAAAFSPSFAFVLLGAPRFDRLRANVKVRVFLDGAGPAAIGVIAGSAVSLAPAVAEPWQHAVLDGILLLALHPGVVLTLLAAATASINHRWHPWQQTTGVR